MRGATKQLAFDFEFGGFGEDPYGTYKAGFTATAVVRREDFGLDWNAPLQKTGGQLVGSDVTLTLDIQLALQA